MCWTCYKEDDQKKIQQGKYTECPQCKKKLSMRSLSISQKVYECIFCCYRMIKND
jgi:hypothetical protein